MELYQLKLFVDLAQTNNFTRVASENYVTQAAVTMQIRKLENELGVKLFHRTTRCVTLLESGQRLLPYAREILQRVEEANAVVRDTKSEVTGVVRVAAVHSIGLYELPPYIKTYLKRYPDVKLRIDYRTSEGIYALLTDGQIDVGIVAFPHEMVRIECIPFLTDRLALVCHEDHPLAARRSIALADLQGINFVEFGGDTPTRRATDEVFARSGIHVNVRMECDNIEILKQMVELNFGVALLPRQALTRLDRQGGLRAIPLRDVVIERPLGILLLKNAPRFRAVKAFVETLKTSGSTTNGRTKLPAD